MSVISSSIQISAEAVGFGIAIGLAKELGSEMVETAINADKLNNMLKVAAGGANAAAVEFQYIQDVSNKLGLEFQSTAESFAKFQIAAKTAGMSLTDQKTVFENISGALAQVGASAAETEGVFKALEQMMSKGMITNEELRQQLGERLYGAYELYAKSLNVTTQQLGEMISKHEVGLDTIVKFSQVVADTYGAGGPVVTAQASVNRLTNEWEAFKRSIVDNKAVISAINAITESLQFWNQIINGADLAHAMQGESILAPRVEAYKKMNDAQKEYVAGVEKLSQLEKDVGQVGFMGHKATTDQVDKQRAKVKELENSYVNLSAEFGKYAKAVVEQEKAGNTTGASHFAPIVDTKGDKKAANEAKRLQEEITDIYRSEHTKRLRLEDDAVSNSIEKSKRREAAEVQIVNESIENYRKQGKLTEQTYSEMQNQITLIHKRGAAEREKIIADETKKQAEETYRKVKMISDIEVSAQKAWAQLEGNKVAIIRATAKAEIQAVDEKYKQLKERYGDDAAAFAAAESQKRAIMEKARQEEIRISGTYLEKLTQHYKDSYSQQGSAIDQFTTNMKDVTVNAFDSIAEGMAEMAISGKASWADMALAIVKQIEMMIAKMLIMYAVQQLVGMIAGGASGSAGAATMSAGSASAAMSSAITPSFQSGTYANGAAFHNGLEVFANGDILTGSTYFPMAGGKTGLMGEAGPEAIMPLSRGADGKLGVRVSGDGSGGGNINIGSINVSVKSNDDETSDEQSYKIAKAIREQLKQLIDTRISNAKRSGNSLNPTQMQTVF